MTFHPLPSMKRSGYFLAVLLRSQVGILQATLEWAHSTSSRLERLRLPDPIVGHIFRPYSVSLFELLEQTSFLDTHSPLQSEAEKVLEKKKLIR